MTTQTVTQAVQQREDSSPVALVPRYLHEFADVLPSHIKSEAFVQMALAALRRDDKLMTAARNDPGSLIFALRDAARLGLEPGTEQYYLTPRKDHGQDRVLGIVGYQGEVELMYRAGAVSSVIVEAVREADLFQYRPGRDERPIHEIDWDLDDRGPLRLAYAYAPMRYGSTSKVVIVNKARIARAKKASGTANSDYSPWKTDEEAMWLKTAAHDLAKWVPTSAEYMREQLRVMREVQAEPSRINAHTGEVIDAEVIDSKADGS